MIKLFLGEVPLRIGRRIYTLRPSLGALYGIEQALGEPIPALADRLREGSARPYMLRCILREGLKAGGARKIPPLPKRELRELASAALNFLIHGLGFLSISPEETSGAPATPGSSAAQDAPPDSPDESAPPPPLKFDPIDWDETYAVARTVLGVGEEEFWGMTMAGLSLMTAACARLNGADAEWSGLPATSDELAWMMEQFP